MACCRSPANPKYVPLTFKYKCFTSFHQVCCFTWQNQTLMMMCPAHIGSKIWFQRTVPVLGWLACARNMTVTVFSSASASQHRKLSLVTGVQGLRAHGGLRPLYNRVHQAPPNKKTCKNHGGCISLEVNSHTHQIEAYPEKLSALHQIHPPTQAMLCRLQTPKKCTLN